MLRNQLKTKKGFTIIEVVLVLAIAGLIFLMVFIALPALQRSQRDTQRKEDVARVITALGNYQANNRGKIPDGTAATVEGKEKPGDIADHDKVGSWGYFYAKYILTDAEDTFADPAGNPYSLVIKADAAAAKSALPNDFKTAVSDKYPMVIAIGSKCNGEEVEAAGGSRKVAVLYRAEGGNVLCNNN